MNPYAKQYQQQYLQNQVQTASPEKLLIMLYDGAIQFVNKAKLAMAAKNIEEIHNNIIGAQRIISEFMNTLDVEGGGELGQNLFSLYEYLHHQLVQANIQKDEAMLSEVLEHLKDLRNTWDQAIKIAAKEKAEMEEDSEYAETTTVRTA